jgi:hypothetical protein
MGMAATFLHAPAVLADTGCPTASSSYASGNGASIPFGIVNKEQLQRLKVTPADWDKKF